MSPFEYITTYIAITTLLGLAASKAKKAFPYFTIISMAPILVSIVYDFTCEKIKGKINNLDVSLTETQLKAINEILPEPTISPIFLMAIGSTILALSIWCVYISEREQIESKILNH